MTGDAWGFMLVVWTIIFSFSIMSLNKILSNTK